MNASAPPPRTRPVRGRAQQRARAMACRR
jgi:hypothetical protein